MFYQFLGGGEDTVGMDMYSFCKVLGPEEGNKQLRRHWDSWVTEGIIKDLASMGAVNSLRLPVGDWQFKPYGPYGEFWFNEAAVDFAGIASLFSFDFSESSVRCIPIGIDESKFHRRQMGTLSEFIDPYQRQADLCPQRLERHCRQPATLCAIYYILTDGGRSGNGAEGTS